jgi:hypothetical protein
VARPPGQFGAPGAPIVPAQPRVPIDDNIIFSDRVRLVLQISFTGRDKLITRLQAGNTNFSVNGWYYRANAESQSGITKGSDATIQSWAVALAFPNLGKSCF